MALLKKTLIYAAGNFGARGMSMLLVPLLTLYLTKEEIGKYDLIFISTLLFIPMLSLQLSDSSFRWLISDTSRINRFKVITNIYSYYFFAALSTIPIFLIINYIFPSTTTLIQLAYLLSQMLYLLILQTARGLSYTKLYALSGLISSFFIIFFSVYTLKFTSLRVDGLLLSAVLSYIITITIVAIKIKLLTYYNYKFLSLKHLKEYTHYSLPLIPNAISWMGITMATRYIIFFKLGIVANGLYAISTKIPALLAVITSFFTLAWQEELIMGGGTNTIKATVIFRKYYTLLLSSIFLLLPFSYILLQKIVPAEFFESWKYVYFLLLAAVFQALSGFLGAQYLKTMETKKIFITSLSGLVITLLLALTLVDHFGLQAISFSTFIGMFLMFIIRFFDSEMNGNYILDLLKIGFLLALSYYMYLQLMENNNLIIISLAGVGLFFLLNWGLLLQITKKINGKL